VRKASDGVSAILNASEGGLSAAERAREIASWAFANAERLDVDGAFPAQEVAELHRLGLLCAIFPARCGGVGLGGLELGRVLRMIGSGSLPLGRLYEGHVNSIALVLRYGRPELIRLVAQEAGEGSLFGVWNTDDSEGLRLVLQDGRLVLAGRKILASGAGHIERPIVTATDERGRRLMIMPRLSKGDRADLSRWTAHGMRASATGAVDFTGIRVEPVEILGGDGDYERQPAFSGGAWRFAAVHVGGMERLLELLLIHLRRAGRGGDPHQAARVGQAAIAVETARLWVDGAAAMAENFQDNRLPGQIVAYVNLARLAVEKAGLELMELVHRSVGLQGLMRPHPIERISRDLATYLRQPGPDRALTTAAAWMLEGDRRASELRD
jgi:alkylation response protein AidB-like acyl-CoA dehydrogenase